VFALNSTAGYPVTREAEPIRVWETVEEGLKKRSGSTYCTHTHTHTLLFCRCSSPCM